MRDEVLAELVERALTDAAFRRRAADDLDHALADAGFQLEPDELAAVREFSRAGDRQERRRTGDDARR